ncbi:MAG: GNAT family protein [Candidatus Nanopelagicales bacterium]
MRAVLRGRYVTLEPIEESHRPLADLQHEFASPDWFDDGLTSDDPLFFAALIDGQPVGRAAIMRIDEPNRVAEIGHVLWGPQMRRTPASTEAVLLMADHLFDWGARRVEWKCDNRNEASKAAALRFGFTFEGVFRQHMVVNGRNRDTAWFSLLDHEWPNRRRQVLAWLDPANFDPDGRQRTRLGGGVYTSG